MTVGELVKYGEESLRQAMDEVLPLLEEKFRIELYLCLHKVIFGDNKPSSEDYKNAKPIKKEGDTNDRS